MPVVSAGLTHDLRETVGQRVADARRATGLTQAGLAELLEVTTNYVARIEGGHENLTLDSIAKLAAVLGVEVAKLFITKKAKPRRPGRPVTKTHGKALKPRS